MPKRKSCGSVLRSRLPPLVQMRSINLPTASLMHSACRPRDRKRARRWYQNLRSAAASQCPTPRDFMPWRFSAAGRLSAWIGHQSGSRKPAQKETLALHVSRTLAQENVVGRIGGALIGAGSVAHSIHDSAMGVYPLHRGHNGERAGAAVVDDVELEPGNVIGC